MVGMAKNPSISRTAHIHQLLILMGLKREQMQGYGGYTMNDIVNHPNHYTDGKIEVIDYIEDKEFNYHLGNAIKYISRAGKKGDYTTDLKKAIWYLEREIKRREYEDGIGYTE